MADKEKVTKDNNMENNTQKNWEEPLLDPDTTLFDNDLLTPDMVANEVAEIETTENEYALPVTEQEAGLPTQIAHPWRTVARTVIQHVSGLIVTGLVWLFASIGIDISELSADLIVSVSVILTVFFSGIVTRIMSNDSVENFLATWLTPISTGVSEENK